MRVYGWWRTVTLVVAMTALGGCDAARDSAGPVSTTAKVQPRCQLGCQEEDPNPQYPGYFLTSAVTPDACAASGDGDADGLSDHCEHILAAAFAPQLYYLLGDNVAREARWAARPEGAMVRIGYLLSYYRDEGSTSWWCGPGNPLEPSCMGHNGDSEAIFLRVYYDEAHQHWILDTAWYSKHTQFKDYPRGSQAYPLAVRYPETKGGYPRAYVSQGKHANYNSQSACDFGGDLWTDTCDGNDTGVRVETNGQWGNIGSRAVPFVDAVTAQSPSHPYYGSGAVEWYWTDVGYFAGWYPDWVGGPVANDSYGNILARQGF